VGRSFGALAQLFHERPEAGAGAERAGIAPSGGEGTALIGFGVVDAAAEEAVFVPEQENAPLLGVVLIQEPPLFRSDLLRVLFQEFSSREAQESRDAVGFGGSDAHGAVARAAVPAAFANEFPLNGVLKNIGRNSLSQNGLGLSEKFVRHATAPCHGMPSEAQEEADWRARLEGVSRNALRDWEAFLSRSSSCKRCRTAPSKSS